MRASVNFASARRGVVRQSAAYGFEQGLESRLFGGESLGKRSSPTGKRSRSLEAWCRRGRARRAAWQRATIARRFAPRLCAHPAGRDQRARCSFCAAMISMSDFIQAPSSDPSHFVQRPDEREGTDQRVALEARRPAPPRLMELTPYAPKNSLCPVWMMMRSGSAASARSSCRAPESSRWRCAEIDDFDLTIGPHP